MINTEEIRHAPRGPLENLRNQPHVVILGAGASVATIPNGDKIGRKISVMDGFIDKLGMRDVLANIKFKSDNLEDIYSELSAHSQYDEIRKKLENAIRNYFIKYRLPDEPTIYDLLLLSLKEKDVVATFNWDPLLLHALKRVSDITKKLPEVLFLHGNVGVHMCTKDNVQAFGPHRGFCPDCGQAYAQCKLLYPVHQKNYNDDLYIKNQWDRLRNYLCRAYIVTIFGYSAPSTDVEAMALLREAWGGSEQRKWEEIEIIDIKSEDELQKTWHDFIYSHHYQVHSSFYESLMAQSPRRSTEDLFKGLMEAQWLDFTNQLTPNMSWEQVKRHFSKILNEEIRTTEQGDNHAN